MSLWAKLQNLPEEGIRAVHRLYGEQFPMVVRSVLAQWIEEKPWIELDLENHQHELYARSLIASLLQEMRAKLALEEQFLFRIQLAEAVKFFDAHYANNNNELYLFNVIRTCIIQERKIIEEFSQGYQTLEDTKERKMPSEQEITQQLEILRRRTQDTDMELKKMQQEQEQFYLHYQEFQKINNLLQQATHANAGVDVMNKLQRDKEAVDVALRQRASALINMRVAWLDKHLETYNALSALQLRVLDDELIRWKRAQQLSGNGSPFDNNLDRIQEWCEGLAGFTWDNRRQLEGLEALCNQLPFQPAHSQTERIETYKQQITNLLSSLVASTFIIEKQPPQVMKTNTRFGSTVRLLVGGKLNVHMTPPQIRVSIISEAQANNLLKSDKPVMDDSSGEILNNTGTMEYHTATKQLSVNFRNMQLRKIKRAEKKGTESVMDEKFSLFFQSKFKVGAGELVFQVWTLSLPVVVIVHGNQEPHAWATVTWDNAFAEPGRIPFVVPEKVPWQRVAEVLNMKFKAAVGRDLTPDSLRFLAGKAFRNPQLQDYDNLALSWGQFSKEPLPDRNFTFWEWFYAILKVTKDHLRHLWTDGLIMGFVGRKQTEEMLLQRPPGTFLLRYSDSELGGVTIAWHAEGQERPEVFMLQPFTSRDFQIRGLPDRINDLKHLSFLYPEVPKDQAFMKYYSPVNDNLPKPNGYIQPVLVTQIPWWAGNMSVDSCPNTPQSGMHNPQSPSDGSMCHENPASVRSNSTDHPMNVGDRMLSQMDYRDLMINMDLPSDMDDPVDYSDISDINVADLMGFSKPS